MIVRHHYLRGWTQNIADFSWTHTAKVKQKEKEKYNAVVKKSLFKERPRSSKNKFWYAYKSKRRHRAKSAIP